MGRHVVNIIKISLLVSTPLMLLSVNIRHNSLYFKLKSHEKQ